MSFGVHKINGEYGSEIENGAALPLEEILCGNDRRGTVRSKVCRKCVVFQYEIVLRIYEYEFSAALAELLYRCLGELTDRTEYHNIGPVLLHKSEYKVSSPLSLVAESLSQSYPVGPCRFDCSVADINQQIHVNVISNDVRSIPLSFLGRKFSKIR